VLLSKGRNELSKKKRTRPTRSSFVSSKEKSPPPTRSEGSSRKSLGHLQHYQETDDKTAAEGEIEPAKMQKGHGGKKGGAIRGERRFNRKLATAWKRAI